MFPKHLMLNSPCDISRVVVQPLLEYQEFPFLYYRPETLIFRRHVGEQSFKLILVILDGFTSKINKSETMGLMKEPLIWTDLSDLTEFVAPIVSHVQSKCMSGPDMSYESCIYSLLFSEWIWSLNIQKLTKIKCVTKTNLKQNVYFVNHFIIIMACQLTERLFRFYWHISAQQFIVVG